MLKTSHRHYDEKCGIGGISAITHVKLIIMQFATVIEDRHHNFKRRIYCVWRRGSQTASQRTIVHQRPVFLTQGVPATCTLSSTALKRIATGLLATSHFSVWRETAVHLAVAHPTLPILV